MDITDRKIAERAARAAGYVLGEWDETVNAYAWLTNDAKQWWNPTEPYTKGDCMGDALRLAVELNLLVTRNTGPRFLCTNRAHDPVPEVWPAMGLGDRDYAMRRAIVCAAAEIESRRAAPGGLAHGANSCATFAG